MPAMFPAADAESTAMKEVGPVGSPAARSSPRFGTQQPQPQPPHLKPNSISNFSVSVRVLVCLLVVATAIVCTVVSLVPPLLRAIDITSRLQDTALNSMATLSTELCREVLSPAQMAVSVVNSAVIATLSQRTPYLVVNATSQMGRTSRSEVLAWLAAALPATDYLMIAFENGTSWGASSVMEGWAQLLPPPLTVAVSYGSMFVAVRFDRGMRGAALLLVNRSNLQIIYDSQAGRQRPEGNQSSNRGGGGGGGALSALRQLMRDNVSATMWKYRQWGSPQIGTSLGRNETVLLCGGPLPLLNEQGQPAAIAVVRAGIQRVRPALRSISSSSPNTRVLVVDPENGRVVGTNGGDPTTIINGGSIPAPAPSIQDRDFPFLSEPPATRAPPPLASTVATMYDVTDALLKQAVTELGDQLLTCPMPCRFELSSESSLSLHSKSSVAVRALDDAYQLNFRTVTVVPASDFLGGVEKSIVLTIVLVCVAMAVMATLSGLGAVVILEPLRLLERRLVALRSLRDSSVITKGAPRRSWISELRSMEHSCDVLSNELCRVRSFLPQSVVTGAHPPAEVSDDSTDSPIVDDTLAARVGGGSGQPQGPREYLMSLQGNSLSGSMDVVSDSQRLMPSTHRQQIPEMSPSTPTSAAVERNVDDVSKSQRRLKRAGGAIGMSLNMECAFATKRITVVIVNTIGFHSMLQKCGPAELQRLHASLAQEVLSSAQAAQGSLDHVLGDHFHLSWNAHATNRVQLHVSSAAHFVQFMLGKLRQGAQFGSPRSKVSTPRLGPLMGQVGTPTAKSLLPLVFGMTSGTALCGNFGCEGLMSPTIFGPLVHQAFVLMHQCKTEGLSCLMNEAATQAIAATFPVLHWSFVKLPQDGNPSLISTLIDDADMSDCEPPSIDRRGTNPLSTTDLTLRSECTHLRLLINRGFELYRRGAVDSAKLLLSACDAQHWMTRGFQHAMFPDSATNTAATPQPSASP